MATAKKSSKPKLSRASENMARADEFDPWKMMQGVNYSRSKVYTKSTDGYGHTHNMQVPIAPSIYAQVKTVIDRADSPWRSPQEFMRDAVAHRLMDDELGEYIDREGALETYILLASIDRSQTERANLKEITERAVKDVEELLRFGQHTRAMERVEELDNLADAFTEPAIAEMVRTVADEAREATVKAYKASRRSKHLRAVGD